MKLPKFHKDHHGKDLESEIRFDPETQYAVIRSSICTGEKVAGFRNKKNGHFTLVEVDGADGDKVKIRI